MASRTVPEINAGSMADIAFLLLIFFLVTTTMDREKAILRTMSIPRENEPPPPPQDPVPQKLILAVQSNDKNEIFLRDQVIKLDLISNEVEKFYLTNRFSQVDANYPEYLPLDGIELAKRIDKSQNELNDLPDPKSDLDRAIIGAKQGELMQLEELNVMYPLYKRLSGQNVMPLINPRATIRIEVAPKTSYETFTKIQAEIQEGIFNLREAESMKLFGVSYAALRRKNDNDKSHIDSKVELDLLNKLFPEKVLEKNPNK